MERVDRTEGRRQSRWAMVMDGVTISTALKMLEDEGRNSHVGRDPSDISIGDFIAVSILRKAAKENPRMTMAEFLRSYDPSKDLNS